MTVEELRVRQQRDGLATPVDLHDVVPLPRFDSSEPNRGVDALKDRFV